MLLTRFDKKVQFIWSYHPEIILKCQHFEEILYILLLYMHNYILPSRQLHVQS